MVLVSYIPYSHISILQAKFSHREGYEASRGGLETMPLDQDIEGGHGEREPGVEIGPDAMHDLFEMQQFPLSVSESTVFWPFVHPLCSTVGLPTITLRQRVCS